ncbi:hypothetical protein CV102_16985 [Natronococcus pandeyae]|uniref:Glucose 1-dehydrogenase n=2 Tax=Natronococcus pandeyae TaxID=2055836 RepID=A0A8J8Q410_9EURY|nr:hypothetical protein CV102_16985 [Natronococcus pandeyae]
MDCSGRTIVVTGGSSGIGRSIALTAAERGANVVVADLEQSPREGGTPTTEAVRDTGSESEFVNADVTDLEDLRRAAEVASELDGTFDAWVNNAGYGATDELTKTDAENWERSIETNLTGVYHGCLTAVESMLANGGGSIVNIASGAGVIGFLNSASYSAAKGGVIALTQQVAVDYAADGIRVNAVSPGFTDTEMLRQDTHDGTESYAEKKTPMRRTGTPEEVADTVVFLVSDSASFITGENVRVDGGYTVQ